MKTNCELIKDLIPAYCRKECGDNNRKLVEEHLSECSDCKKYYDNYCSRETNNNPEEEKRIVESFKLIKKKLRLKNVVIVACTLVGVLLLFYGVKYMYLKRMKVLR